MQVYSFAGEDKARAQYSSALETTLRLGLGQGLAKGLGMGVTFGVLFCAWALQFWVGSLLVIHGTANGGQALTTMFAVILGGLSVQLTLSRCYFVGAREPLCQDSASAWPVGNIFTEVLRLP